MPFQNILTDPLTVPSDAGPGQARIVIGTVLPPPLDTYIIQPFDQNIVAAIIFYMGTPQDDDYAFIGMPGIAPGFGLPAVTLFYGAVVNGVVVETDNPGFPAGYQMDATGVSDLFHTFNLTPVDAFGQQSRVQFQTGHSQGVGINAGPLKTSFHKFAPPFSNDTTIVNTYAIFSGSPSASLVKLYEDSAIKVTITGSLFCSGSTNTNVGWGVNVKQSAPAPGTNYDIGETNISQNTVRNYYTVTDVITGLPAGNYPFVSVCWKRISGAGVPTLAVGTDFTSILVEELST